MRKHRHFALVFTALLGTGFLAQRTITPSPSGPGGAAVELTSASSPVSRHVSAQSVAIHPLTGSGGDPMLALTSAITSLPPVVGPPPPPPPPPPRPTPAVAAPSASSAGVWLELRRCESDDNYGDDTGNGYFGAYQFSPATWHGLGLGGLPSDASPAQQDRAAQELQARSGWGQWPVCSRRLGLL